MREKMKTDLQNKLDALYAHYMYAHDLIAVYEHIGELNADNKKTAGNFFCIVESACVDAFMMEFARLYDNHGSCTIPSILKKCKDDSSLFYNPNEVKNKVCDYLEIMKQDVDIANAINTIKLRRDKMLAHNDQAYFINPSKDTTCLPMYQIRFLRDYTGNVIEYLLKALRCDVKKTPMYNKDLDNIL